MAQMHFPHVRLNEGKFVRYETAAEWKREWRPPPPSEGFGRTEQENVRVVQAGPNKVHFAIRMSRRNCAGEGAASHPHDAAMTSSRSR